MPGAHNRRQAPGNLWSDPKSHQSPVFGGAAVTQPPPDEEGNNVA